MGAHLDRVLAAAQALAERPLELTPMGSLFARQEAGWMRAGTGAFGAVRGYERMDRGRLEEVHGYSERHLGGGLRPLSSIAGDVATTAHSISRDHAMAGVVRQHMLSAYHAMSAPGGEQAAVFHLRAAHAAAAGVKDEQGQPMQALIERHLREMGAGKAGLAALKQSTPRRPAVPSAEDRAGQLQRQLEAARASAKKMALY